jgi:hypothetical protein
VKTRFQAVAFKRVNLHRYNLASHDSEEASAAADALLLPQTDFYGDAVGGCITR